MTSSGAAGGVGVFSGSAALAQRRAQLARRPRAAGCRSVGRSCLYRSGTTAGSAGAQSISTSQRSLARPDRKSSRFRFDGQGEVLHHEHLQLELLGGQLPVLAPRSPATTGRRGGRAPPPRRVRGHRRRTACAIGRRPGGGAALAVPEGRPAGARGVGHPAGRAGGVDHVVPERRGVDQRMRRLPVDAETLVVGQRDDVAAGEHDAHERRVSGEVGRQRRRALVGDAGDVVPEHHDRPSRPAAAVPAAPPSTADAWLGGPLRPVVDR